MPYFHKGLYACSTLVCSSTVMLHPLMKHILGEEASSGMVPAYTAFSVLLTVLHSPQARCVSVSHPDYNFELHCTEVTMS